MWPWTSPSTTTPTATFLSLTLSLRGPYDKEMLFLTHSVSPGSCSSPCRTRVCDSCHLVAAQAGHFHRHHRRDRGVCTSTLAMSEVSVLLTFLNACQSSLIGPQLTAGGTKAWRGTREHKTSTKCPDSEASALRIRPVFLPEESKPSWSEQSESI